MIEQNLEVITSESELLKQLDCGRVWNGKRGSGTDFDLAVVFVLAARTAVHLENVSHINFAVRASKRLCTPVAKALGTHLHLQASSPRWCD